MYLILRKNKSLKILSNYLIIPHMKHSFFDLWSDEKCDPKDLPKYYETSHDYRCNNRDIGEGWSEENKWHSGGFAGCFDSGFADYSETKYDNDMSHPFEATPMEDDYPECVFGLKKSSSYEEMKKAYRDAILQSHPDKSGKEDTEEFRMYQQAWEDYTS